VTVRRRFAGMDRKKTEGNPGMLNNANYSLSDYATKNVKCPSCGMFNPPALEKCRRCGADVPKKEK
jgi:ribosomal protein L40E